MKFKRNKRDLVYSVEYCDYLQNGKNYYHNVDVILEYKGVVYNILCELDDEMRVSCTYIKEQRVFDREQLNFGYTLFDLLEEEIKKVVSLMVDLL